MIPFMTEDIYQNLVCSVDKNAPESIHLCDYPVAVEEYIDKDLEASMENVLSIVVLGRSARNASGIKNRQPIGKMYVKADNVKLDKFFTDIVADELNIKTVEFTDDVSAFASYSIKPQLKTVGPKYGKFLNQIRTALTELDSGKAVAEVNANGFITLDIDGNEIRLETADLLIESSKSDSYATESDHGITVVLDTQLSEELIEEGFVREIISKVQTMRKDSGFEVMDNIRLFVTGNDKVGAIVAKNAETIKDEVLAAEIADGTCDNSKEWNINGEKVSIGVEKL